MFFLNDTSLQEIQNWVAAQYGAIGAQKRGYDVELRPHRVQRSNEQNRFLMAILLAIVRFYHDTGFMPSGLSPWAMRTDILKEYFKARAGVLSTAKLSSADFGKFVDFIQHTMVNESDGEFEILQPDSAYMRALCEMGERG